MSDNLRDDWSFNKKFYEISTDLYWDRDINFLIKNMFNWIKRPEDITKYLVFISEYLPKFEFIWSNSIESCMLSWYHASKVKYLLNIKNTLKKKQKQFTRIDRIIEEKFAKELLYKTRDWKSIDFKKKVNLKEKINPQNVYLRMSYLKLMNKYSSLIDSGFNLTNIYKEFNKIAKTVWEKDSKKAFEIFKEKEYQKLRRFIEKTGSKLETIENYEDLILTVNALEEVISFLEKQKVKEKQNKAKQLLEEKYTENLNLADYRDIEYIKNYLQQAIELLRKDKKGEIVKDLYNPLVSKVNKIKLSIEEFIKKQEQESPKENPTNNKSEEEGIVILKAKSKTLPLDRAKEQLANILKIFYKEENTDVDLSESNNSKNSSENEEGKPSTQERDITVLKPRFRKTSPLDKIKARILKAKEEINKIKKEISWFWEIITALENSLKEKNSNLINEKLKEVKTILENTNPSIPELYYDRFKIELENFFKKFIKSDIKEIKISQN